MEEKQKSEKEEKNKLMVIAFRIFQAIFFGVFALGVASIFGDLSDANNWDITSFSITMTIFGLIGAIITEIQARICKSW